jgi:hypothetical protein
VMTAILSFNRMEFSWMGFSLWQALGIAPLFIGFGV